MNYKELRKSLMVYYEKKLTAGALMAIDDIFSVRSATDEEVIHIYKTHLLSVYMN